MPRTLPAHALLASSLLSGCAFTNPIGFWDITELSVAIDGGDAASQVDYGTFEVVESSGYEVATALVRYFPVATDGEAAFAPQETPLQSTATWDGEDDEEGFQGNRIFNFFQGTLVVDRYRGPRMTLKGEGMWSGTLSGVVETTPVELTVELER